MNGVNASIEDSEIAHYLGKRGHHIIIVYFPVQKRDEEK